MRRLALLILASSLLASCYEPPPEGYTIGFDFAGLTAEEVPHVEVYVLEECSGSNILGPDDNVLGRVGFEMDGEPQPAELPITRTGTYGLLAIGSTRDCTMVSSVCRTVTFEDFVVEEITLRLNPHTTPVACDWPSTCSPEGVCDVLVDNPAPFQGCMANNPPAFGIQDLAAGDNHTCVLFDDGAASGGTVYCWGDNSFNQINNDPTGRFPQPEISGTPRSLMIGVGGNTWCGAGVGGTSCRGSGNLLSTEWYDDPRLLEASATHACLLSDSDSEDILRCWGTNDHGQLLEASGTPATFGAPQVSFYSRGAIVGLAVGASANGDAYSCYASSTEVTCAGQGPGIGSPVPMTLAWVGTSIQLMTGGDRHACLIDDGALFCWGDNDHGQLGLETFGVRRDLPTRVGTATDWETVSAGGDTSCGIRGGELFCWGRNDFGQAGDGPVPSRLPRAVAPTDTWDRVAVGRDHACAATLGALWCWGRGDTGQLGGESELAWTPNQQRVCFP